MSGKTDLLEGLLKANVFRVGEFLLKSGNVSPIYIDLRSIITYPSLVKSLAEYIYSREKADNISVDVVCGVPYTALPMASVYSVLYNVPMLMKRQEAKYYGTKKMVEGTINVGAKCLIIEDVVTTGSSVIETAAVLREQGLLVNDCIVVINRSQGAEDKLLKAGIRLHSLFTITDLFNKYCLVNKVDEDMVLTVNEYFKKNSCISVKKEVARLPYNIRSEACTQPVSKKLLHVISVKETNLCLSTDVKTSSELLKLADQLGPYICILKTHIDILSDFNEAVGLELANMAKKHNFLIMEDRKFADIGNTVMSQYSGGLYKIVEWADIVTVHGLPGCGIIDALKKASYNKERACVLLAEMSSKGALTDESYKNKVVEMAKSYSDFVIGFVIQDPLPSSDNLINFSPGINISSLGDSLGQQYKSPKAAVNNGADILIVGRGVINAENMLETALEYKKQGYEAYLTQCKNINQDIVSAQK